MERLDLDGSVYSPAELAIHIARYLPLRELVRGRRVLDIACGQGLGAYLMRHRWGAREVVGVDVSGDAVERARRLFGNDGLDFRAADAEEFLQRPMGKFDVVTSVETVEHLPDPLRFLQLIARPLQGSGLIYITCPNDPWYFGRGRSLNAYHLSSLSEAEFLSMASSSLGAPDHVFRGSTLSGFGVYALPLERSAGYDDARNVLEEDAHAVVVPDPASRPDDQRLTDRDSLFVAALWNVGGGPVSVRSALAAWPSGASFRQPPITSAPRVVRERLDRPTMTLVHGAGEAGVAIAAEVSACLSDRLDVRLLRAGTDQPDLARELFIERPADFIHFVDAGTPGFLFWDAIERAAVGGGNEGLIDALLRPVITFSVVEPAADHAEFRSVPAHLFDGYLIDRRHGGHPPVLKHRPPAAVLQGDPSTMEVAAAWLRLLRNAEAAAGHGLRAARVAEACRVLGARRRD